MQCDSIPLKKPLVYGSICSGIEAATVAWHPLGWKPAFFSEIENFPRAVLQHHYPSVPLHGDFTTIQEHDYDSIDLLVGGTPCQAFSVAGLRKGFADERGNLTLEYVRLAQRLRPRWLVWENVPGVLSIDGGRAFGSFLGALAQCGYGFAYRILDAQYFGVPQRRRRVFVVGHLGDWRPAAAILFERESLLRDLTPSREKGERPAPTISARTKGGGGLGTDFDLDGGLIGCWWDGGQVSQTLDAVLYKGQTMPEKNRFPAVLQPVSILEAGARTGVSTNDPRAGIGISEPGDPMFTLQAAHQHAVAFDLRGREGGAMPEGPYDTANIRAASGGSSRSYIASPMAVRRITPRECERLQGFPDDYTLVPYRGKPAADGPRYKSLGNSMAVPCMKWIGERIQHVREQQLTMAA